MAVAESYNGKLIGNDGIGGDGGDGLGCTADGDGAEGVTEVTVTFLEMVMI